MKVVREMDRSALEGSPTITASCLDFDDRSMGETRTKSPVDNSGDILSDSYPATTGGVKAEMGR